MLKYNKTIEEWEQLLEDIRNVVFDELVVIGAPLYSISYCKSVFMQFEDIDFKKDESMPAFGAMPLASEDIPLDDVEEDLILQSDIPEFAGIPEEIVDIANRPMESFSERLLRLIDARNLNDPDVYKVANISRQTFSKIRSGKVVPTKKTIFALILSLKLNIDEAKDLLMSAGFAIQDNSVVDLAVKYFIEHEMYDITEDEEILYTLFYETLVSKE